MSSVRTEVPVQANAPKKLWPALVLAFLSITGGLLTIQEPLWIDELHTYWTASESFSLIPERARFGNQSPLWFWLESICLQALTTDNSADFYKQTAIRLPSLFFWSLTYLLIGYSLRPCKQYTLACVALGMLILCDQISWFYSIEARPYSAVTFFVVLSAMSQLRLLALPYKTCRMLYIGSAVVAIYLHYTALMVILALAIAQVIASWILKKPQDNNQRNSLTSSDNVVHHGQLQRKSLLWDLSVVLVLAFPALLALAKIGQNRELWQSFAGNTSLSNIRSILPIDAWLLLALAGSLIDRRLSSSKSPVGLTNVLILLTSVVGCVIAVWMMAYLQLAPLVHTRYLIGGYGLIALGTGILLASINRRWLLVTTAFCMALAWNLTQGGPFWIRHGQAIVWQRHEDWRTATKIIEEKLRQEPHAKIYFAPMLVETQNERSIARFQSERLMYGLDAAQSLYVGRPQDARRQSAQLLSNELENWRSLLPSGQETSVALPNSGYLVVCRAGVDRIEPWLREALISKSQSWKMEKLFGNNRQRLSVFWVTPIFGEQQP